MAKASFYWGSFLAGEFSQRAQGNIADPRYATAMNLCYNAIIDETGAWTRRPLFQFIGTTYRAYPGKLFTMPFRGGLRSLLEVTNNGDATYARVWTPPVGTMSGTTLGDRPYALYCDDYDTVSVFATAAPAQITTTSTHVSWATDDSVVLFNASGGTIAARQFLITKVDSSNFTLRDAMTGFGLDGTLPEFGVGVAFVGHVKTWTSDTSPLPISIDRVKAARFTPADNIGFLWQHNTSPGMLSVTYDDDGLPTYSFTDPTFKWLDGPYLDSKPGTGQGKKAKGVISVPVADYVFTETDNVHTFTSDDVGRAIRLYNQPPAWAAGTTYALNDVVTYNENFWKLGKASVPAGTAPGQSYTTSGVSYAPWILSPALGYWSYGSITAVGSTTAVTMTLSEAPNTNGNTIDEWQLGAWTVNQYPSCGCWADGRLWTGGALSNRFDASVSGINESFFDTSVGISTSRPVWSPSDRNGVVLDNSAISYSLNSSEDNEIFWIVDDPQGVIVGTGGGEWVLSGAQGDASTALNILAKKPTSHRCHNAEPVRAGSSLLFVQADQRQIVEYLADSFTNRFTGRVLNEDAMHIPASDITDLAYMDGIIPLVWVRDYVGRLVACTYRRLSRWATEAPAVFAFSQHVHGLGKQVESIASATRPEETIAVITTNDIVAEPNGARYIEVLANPLNPAIDTMLNGDFLDEAMWDSAWGSDQISGGGPGPDGGTTASGKFYQEFTINSISTGSSGGQPMGVGVAGFNQTRATGFTLPRTGNPGVGAQECVVFCHEGTVWTSNAKTSSGAATYSAGDRVAIRVDTPNRTIAFRNVTTNSSWSSDYTTSGIDTAAGLFVFFCGTGFSGTDKATLIPPGSETGTIPATFEAWGSIVWSSSVQSYSYSTASLNATFASDHMWSAIGPGVTTGAPSNIPSPQSVGTNYFNVGIPRVGAPPNDDAWQAGYIGVLATGGKDSP